MQLTEAAKLARLLMNAHGLRKWRFGFEYTVECQGSCSKSKKLICLSEPYVQYYGAAFVVDIMLHEIAHALSPADANHASKIWRQHARRLGAMDKNWHDKYSLPGRYQTRCERCNLVSHWYTDPRYKGLECVSCGKSVKCVDVSEVDDPASLGLVADYVTLKYPKRKGPRIIK